MFEDIPSIKVHFLLFVYYNSDYDELVLPFLVGDISEYFAGGGFLLRGEAETAGGGGANNTFMSRMVVAKTSLTRPVFFSELLPLL